MKKILILLCIIICSFVTFGQDLKGGNHLVEGEEAYRLYIKIRPEALIDIDNGIVKSFRKTRSAETSTVLDKINKFSFSQVVNLNEDDRKQIRSGTKTRSVKSGFDKSLFSGLIEMKGSQYIDKDTLLALANELEKYDIVEYCEISPITPPPPPSIYDEFSYVPPATPNYESQQFYLNGNSGSDVWGIDARYAWGIGIYGQGVSIADVEWGWDYQHEDFAGQNVIDALTTTNHNYDDHGTAVMGEMYAANNGFGVTGAVYGADRFIGFSEITNGRSAAILMALDSLNAGDVLVYEMQTGGQNSEYVPADYVKTVWDVTKQATQAGIIVVAAAGNGNQNLDASFYSSYMARGDNGSIIVGAGTKIARNKCSFSTYGSRIDIMGIGDWSITTTGYGGLYNGGPHATYTSDFSGTSSSTPIVASAAVAIQSYAKNILGKTLTPTEMRTLLKETGTAGGTGWGSNVPKLPNIKNAIEKLELENTQDGKYMLTVNNGLGSGRYESGEKVSITANSVTGLMFSHWSGGAGYINDSTLVTAEITMPEKTLTVNAEYTALPTCSVSLINQSYMVGQDIKICWTTTDAAATDSVTLVLLTPDNIPVSIGREAVDKNEFVWTVNNFASPNDNYKVIAKLSRGNVSDTSWAFSIVENDPSYFALSNDLISVYYFDSEHTTHENTAATNVIDGDPNTFWHTEWATNYQFPHEIVLSADTVYLFSGLIYLPRQSGVNGRIDEYEVYVSMDGETWDTIPVASGNWEAGAAEKVVYFDEPVYGQYVKLRTLSELNGNTYASVAELTLLYSDEKIDISTAEITTNTDLTYTGNLIKPIPIVVFENDTLIEKIDYTVLYFPFYGAINVGDTISVVVTGVGLYKDIVEGKFVITEDLTSITGKDKQSEIYGIYFFENPVNINNKAEIIVVTPEQCNIKMTITDMLGNIVFEDNTRTNHDNKAVTVWNLTNRAGRKISAGSYSIVVEAKSGTNGKVYQYRTIVGVRR